MKNTFLFSGPNEKYSLNKNDQIITATGETLQLDVTCRISLPRNINTILAEGMLACYT